MLLAIDIGNSNITCGIFEENLLQKEWRAITEKQKNDAWFRQKIETETNGFDISNIVIGSVVPELDTVFTTLCKNLYRQTPLFVSTTLKTGIQNLSEKPTHLGADRLCDIVAAINQYPGNRIVVDMGTATKFEVISEHNEYLGGAISPGVQVSFDALIQRASKLSSINLTPPKKIVGGFTTEEHLTSGYIYGFASLVDGMILRIKEEMSWKSPSVIFTGGFTDMISPFLKEKVIIEKNLTLQGLRLLWKFNR